VALLLREAHPTARAGRVGLARGVAAQMAASARRVVAHRPLLFAVLFSTVLFTLVRMAIYLHQPFLSAAGFDLSQVGLVMALCSLAAAVGAYRIEPLRRAVGERALVLGLPAVMALSYAALGTWCASWGVAMLLVQSLVNGVYSPLSKELLNREILDSSERATVLSVESMARRLAFGLFAPVAGRMMDRHGLDAGLYTCAALGLVATGALGLHLWRRAALARGFDGERTPTPLPELDAEPVPEPVVAVASAAER
jgi:predicted MFS family arabinose efflux permease